MNVIASEAIYDTRGSSPLVELGSKEQQSSGILVDIIILEGASRRRHPEGVSHLVILRAYRISSF